MLGCLPVGQVSITCLQCPSHISLMTGFTAFNFLVDVPRAILKLEYTVYMEYYNTWC